MQNAQLESFFRGDYMPHGHCYLWQPHILWTNVISDLIIATSYFSIPIAIILFATKRKDIGYSQVFVLFSLFILCCGITHIFGIVTIWQGVYGAHGIAKAVTAVVSLSTAIYIYKLMPSALSMPTLRQYDGVRSELQAATAEQLNLQRQLKENAAFEFMIGAMPVGAVLLDQDFKIVLSNKTLQHDFGYSAEKLLGKPLQTLFTDDVLQADNFQRLLTSAKPHNHEIHQSFITQGQSRSGTAFPVEVSVVKDELNGVEMTMVSIQNVTHSRHVENQLLESHQRLQRAINATKDGIWEWNVATNEVDYSPQMMMLIGEEEHIDNPSFAHWKSHIHPDYVELVETKMKRHFEHGEKYEVEYIGRNQQGDYGWFFTRGSTIFDANNKPRIMSGALSYIHEKKLIEQELARKNQFLNAIYDGSSHAIFVIEVINPKNKQGESDFEFVAMNEACAKHIGSSFDSVKGQLLSSMPSSILSNDVQEQVIGNYRRCLQQKKMIDYVEMLQFKDQEQWFKTTLYPIFDTDGEVTHIVGAASDISQIKQYEKQLSANQAYLTNIIDNAICGLYVYNIESQTNTRINQRYTDITGYTAEDLAGLSSLMELFHEEDLPNVIKHIEQVIASDNSDIQIIQYRFRHKLGHWIWCYSFDSVLSRDDHGQPVEMLGTFIDITDLKHNADKLAESNQYLQRFAYVASHDLQEPLRKISAFSDSLYHRLESQLEDDAAYELERLKDAASRMRIMIQDILSLSKINADGVNRRWIPIKDLIDQVQDNLTYLIAESEAEISINDNIDVFADQGLMVQMLQNLIQNSIKFKQPGQPPVIEITVEKQPHATLIKLVDNGIGMNKKDVTGIFEPFKRLVRRDEYEGSGIGLAICKQIIKVHDGHIHCSSELGSGTEFIIELPNG